MTIIVCSAALWLLSVQTACGGNTRGVGPAALGGMHASAMLKGGGGGWQGGSEPAAGGQQTILLGYLLCYAVLCGCHGSVMGGSAVTAVPNTVPARCLQKTTGSAAVPAAAAAADWP
jgi:hypothetical protein